MVIETYNELHLGDNIIHLNYIKRLTDLYPNLEVIHYCNQAYCRQLISLFSDCRSIQILSLNLKRKSAINCWIGDRDYFYKSANRFDWVSFHLEFFDYFSNILNVENPIKCSHDLLLDCPSLNGLNSKLPEFDFLIINSRPESSQIVDFNTNFFDDLSLKLHNKGYKVITTHPNSFNMSTIEMEFNLLEIGQISSHCKAIIGVPNGPAWPTFNVFNCQTVKFRIFWLSVQSLKLTNNCFSISSPDEIMNLLLQARIL